MEQTEFRTDQEVGQYIKEQREARGLSQAELGAELGLGQPAVSKIEAGERAATGRELVVLSNLFAVTTSQILRKEAAAPVFFRVGDGTSAGAKESLQVFRQCIGEFHALATVVHERTADTV